MYDGTVRNSSGGIVQLTYGDDGMDPVCMEAKDGQPVDLPRVMMKTKVRVYSFNLTLGVWYIAKFSFEGQNYHSAMIDWDIPLFFSEDAQTLPRFPIAHPSAGRVSGFRLANDSV